MSELYVKYLMEGMEYSFEEETAQEDYVFKKRLIGDVVDILSNAGPCSENAKISEEDDLYLPYLKVAGPILRICQKYDEWWVDKNYQIIDIEYLYSMDKTEAVNFTIKSKDSLYATLCNLTTGYFLQFKSMSHISTLRKLHDYGSYPLQEIILDIINQIKNCHV